jgi:glucosamine kinase
MARHLYLGFDGGGTKTECALLGADGHVVGQGLGGPSNPLRAGFEAACSSLRQAADTALAAAHAEASQLHSVCAGLAGAGRTTVAERIAAFLAEQFPGARVHVTTDFEVALEAAGGAGPAVVLIAGTGSVAVGRGREGQILRAGGMGPWIGDEGSAFDIGRRAVIVVAQSRDGLGPVTSLAELIAGRLQFPAWEQLIERIAQAPDEVFPKVFPVVVEAAESGDSIAREILQQAALGLSRIAVSVIRRLGLVGDEFPLAKCGGVHGRSHHLDSALDSLLHRIAPGAKIGPLEVSPAVGAARLAMRLFPGPAAEAVQGGIR